MEISPSAYLASDDSEDEDYTAPFQEDTHVFVLRSNDGDYYVDKTSLPDKERYLLWMIGDFEIRRHVVPYTVETVTPERPDVLDWLRDEIAHWALKHGLDRVRTECYSNNELLLEEHLELFDLVTGARGLCRRCGRGGHARHECVEETLAAWANHNGEPVAATDREPTEPPL